MELIKPRFYLWVRHSGSNWSMGEAKWGYDSVEQIFSTLQDYLDEADQWIIIKSVPTMAPTSPMKFLDEVDEVIKKKMEEK